MQTNYHSGCLLLLSNKFGSYHKYTAKEHKYILFGHARLKHKKSFHEKYSKKKNSVHHLNRSLHCFNISTYPVLVNTVTDCT